MKKLILASIIAIITLISSCTKKYTTVQDITNVTRDTTITIIIQDSIGWTYANVDSGWTSPTTENGGGVKYGILGNIVHVSGFCIANDGAANTIFYLDSAERPIYIKFVSCITDNGTVIPALIYPSGQFYITNPPIGHSVHLDNIQFPIN